MDCLPLERLAARGCERAMLIVKREHRWSAKRGTSQEANSLLTVKAN